MDPRIRWLPSFLAVTIIATIYCEAQGKAKCGYGGCLVRFAMPGLRSGFRATMIDKKTLAVVWDEYMNDDVEYEVHLLLKDTKGKQISPQFTANTWSTSEQSSPAVAPLPSGDFVVVWQSRWQDLDGYGIFGCRFDKEGWWAGNEFQINTWTTGEQESPQIASLLDGGFVVVWVSLVGTRWTEGGLGSGVFGQRFDSLGNRVGSEFRINSRPEQHPDSPALASLWDGTLVALWVSYQSEKPYARVFGQRLGMDGKKIGPEFQLVSNPYERQDAVAVAPLTGGGFIVTWQGYTDDYENGIYSEIFDASGNKSAGPFKASSVNADSAEQGFVSSLSNGGFVVAWTALSRTGFKIFAQRFYPDGRRKGQEFLASMRVGQHQIEPSVAPLPRGGFVVFWSWDYPHTHYIDMRWTDRVGKIFEE